VMVNTPIVGNHYWYCAIPGELRYLSLQ
jgi:hypothetical protein